MKQIFRGMQNAAESIEENFSELLAKISKDYKVVFNGATLLNGSQTSQWAASDLTDELVIILSQYDDANGEAMNSMFTVERIPKKHIELFPGMNYRLNLYGEKTKVIYPELTKITGHDVNGQGANRTFVIRAILVR